MQKDAIVNEVRVARQAHAQKFCFDLKAIYDDLKQAEEKSERKVVSFPPKPALLAQPLPRQNLVENSIKQPADSRYNLL
jgi:hypothetical protein